jgi:hypothetical protein
VSQVGSIYINLLADTARFTSGINNASNQLSRFANQVDGALRQVERGLQQFGARMTTRVTLPIVGFGVAAMKAADQNKKAQESIERMGLQAQKALEPVGRVLIDTLERARPAIEQGIRFVNGLAQAFADLDPKTQRMIVAAAGLAASVGPVSLALAAATTGVRAFSTVLLVPIANLARVTAAATLSAAALSRFALAAGGVAVAFTGFTFGQTLYDQFRWVQEGAANFVWGVQRGLAAVQLAADTMVAHVKAAFADLMKLFSRVGGADWMFDALSAIDQQTANSYARWARQFDGAAIGDLGNLDDTLARLNTEFDARKKEIDQIRSITMGSIAQTFEGPNAQTFDPAGKFFENWRANMATVRSSLEAALDPSDLTAGYDALLAKIQSLLESGSLPFVQTRQEAEAAAKAIDENARAMDRLLERAKAIRADVRPDEVIAERLRELEQLRDLFPQIISADVFEDAAKKISGVVEKVQKRVETFGDKLRDTISGFANDAGDALARFAVRGEGSFKELAEAWAEQLLSMALTTQAFKPLFDALGTGLGGLFGATTPTPPNTDVSPKLAGGGIITKPTYFSSGRGVGVMGEAGPEAVMPLSRMREFMRPAGDGVVVQIIDQRGSGQRPEVSRTRSGDGRDLVKIVIRDTVQELIGTGGMDKPLGRRFGLRPRPQY